MSGVEGLVINVIIGGITNLLTDHIDPLFKIFRNVVRYKDECRKLEEVVGSIKTNVQHIEGQLQELQSYNPNVGKDLKIVADSVEQLNKELHLAGLELHKCQSAPEWMIRINGNKFSEKITVSNGKISALAGNLPLVSLHLTQMLENARLKCPSMGLQDQRDLQRRDSIRLAQHVEHLFHNGRASSSSPSAYEEVSGSQHSFHHENYAGPSRSMHRSHITSIPHVAYGTSPVLHQRATTPVDLDHMTVEGIDTFLPHSFLSQQESLRHEAESDQWHSLATAYGHDPEPIQWKY